MSKNKLGSTGIGEINDDKPKMNKILNTLEPITFPSAMSLSPLLAAITEVTNSGNYVPIDTIVRPIIFSLTPNVIAISDAQSTTSFPPNIMPIIPTIDIIRAFERDISQVHVLPEELSLDNTKSS